MVFDTICGVPQGSALGPKVFTLYHSEIPKVSGRLKRELLELP